MNRKNKGTRLTAAQLDMLEIEESVYTAIAATPDRAMRKVAKMRLDTVRKMRRAIEGEPEE